MVAMKTTTQRLTALLGFLLAYVIQPAAFSGCNGGDGDPAPFDYGHSDMSALLEEIQQKEAWRFRPIQGESTYRLELEVEETAGPDDDEGQMSMKSGALALLLRRAHACGTRTRTFSAVASACFTIYETKLPVRAKVMLYRVGNDRDELVFDQAIPGHLVAQGLTLAQAHVELWLSQPGFSLSISREHDQAFTLNLHAAVVGNENGGIVPLD